MGGPGELEEKQHIILRHYHDGESQRKIHRETGISRKTIRKYIQKYEQAKKELLKNSSGCHSDLVQDIMDKPQYDISKRKKVKLTEKLMARIEFYVKEYETKRAEGKAKQQMKKIDIYEELINEGFDIVIRLYVMQ
jgi:transposase